MLLGCEPGASVAQVLSTLRQHLEECALMEVDVDAVEDAEVLRALLRQAQAALRR